MKKRSPYWLDFLKHPRHQTALLAGVAVTVMLSMPWGGDAIGLGLLAIAAAEVIALAIVPSLPNFREWADKKERRELRAQLQGRLLAEIHVHGGSSHLHSYEAMQGRVQSLYRMADDSGSTLSGRDVEQIEDASLDYLRLCLSDAVMQGGPSGGESLTAHIKRKLAQVRERLGQPGLEPDEAQQLRRAEADLAESLARQSRMGSRKAMLEASLISMPVRMEEVYQMVMSSPQAGNLGALLEDSLARLKISEEVAMDLDAEFGFAELAQTLSSPAKVKAQPPQAARRGTVGTKN